MTSPMTEEERAFWDRAFCAALKGPMSYDLESVADAAKVLDTTFHEVCATGAAQIADYALRARRARMKET